MHRTGQGQDRTGQDRTGQDRTGQDRTGQDRTGQDRTGQDRTGQDRTGQDRTGQDRTGQDRTGQDRTGQDRTGQDSDRTQDRTGQFRLSSGPGNSEGRDECRCGGAHLNQYQILHTGSLRWLGSCFTTWLHIFSSFRRRCFLFPRVANCNGADRHQPGIHHVRPALGNMWHTFRQIIGTTTWFAQIDHIMSPTHATMPRTGAFCVLKFSNFCHHIRTK